MALNPDGVARYEELRLVRWLDYLAPIRERVAGGVMARTSKPSWMNKAVGMGLSGPVGPTEIAAVVDFFLSAGLEPRVELSPYADESLLHELAGAGFILRRFAHVLARSTSLERAEPNQPDRIEGLDITVASRSERGELDAVCAILGAAFYPAGAGAVPDPVDMLAWRRTAEHPGVFAALGRIDGAPVAAGLVEVEGDLATLFAMGVIPDARGRGIQRAMIDARLDIAGRRGARVATITTDPGAITERNALRRGFSPVCARAIMARPIPSR